MIALLLWNKIQTPPWSGDLAGLDSSLSLSLLSWSHLLAQSPHHSGGWGSIKPPRSFPTLTLDPSCFFDCSSFRNLAHRPILPEHPMENKHPHPQSLSLYSPPHLETCIHAAYQSLQPHIYLLVSCLSLLTISNTAASTMCLCALEQGRWITDPLNIYWVNECTTSLFSFEVSTCPDISKRKRLKARDKHGIITCYYRCFRKPRSLQP